MCMAVSIETSLPSEAGNPVGKLQEVTQKKYLAPPEYEFQDNGRLPHEREYNCTVKLLQYTSSGKFNAYILISIFSKQQFI